MGFGILVIAALAAGVYFLFRLFGWHHLFTTLLNPSSARFARTEDTANATTVFQVTPARTSWTYLLVVGGVLAGFFYLTSQTPGAVLLFLIVLVIAIPFVGYILLKSVRHRKPVRLAVTSAALTDGARSWPLGDIADLSIREGLKVRRGEHATIVTQHAVGGSVVQGKPVSGMIGRSIGRRQAQRCYLVTLRSRSGSKEQVLCGGLTLPCAEALASDLRACIRGSSPAPAN